MQRVVETPFPWDSGPGTLAARAPSPRPTRRSRGRGIATVDAEMSELAAELAREARYWRSCWAERMGDVVAALPKLGKNRRGWRRPRHGQELQLWGESIIMRTSLPDHFSRT